MRWEYMKFGGGKTMTVQSRSALFYLYLDFPESTWNKKKERHVLELIYSEYRSLSNRINFLFENKTPSSKECVIRFPYMESIPKIEIGTAVLKMKYDDFTIDFCKQYAVNHLKNKLLDVLYQLNTESVESFNFEK